MQATAAPWRAVLRTTHLLVAPTSLAASSFHSTPVSSGKWKDKFDCKHEHGAQKLSKNYERVEVQAALLIRMISHDSKPLGKDLSLMAQQSRDKVYTITENVKKIGRGSTISSVRSIMCILTKSLKTCSVRIIVLPGPIYRGRVLASEIHRSDLGLVNRRERVCSDSDDESEDDTSETTNIGSHAHRAILGLPPCGPLTLDAVKIAFRASALRWHPDKHPGSSQVTQCQGVCYDLAERKQDSRRIGLAPRKGTSNPY